MNNLKLELPNPKYITSFLESVREFDNEAEPMHPTPSDIYSDETFYAFLDILKNRREGKRKIHCTCFWIIFKNKYVGKIDIRHHPSKTPQEIGGNISAAIRPSKRKKGLATQALKLALQHCKEIGLDKILCICDKANIPSIKVVTSNGGILKGEFFDPGRNRMMNHYWIKL